MSVLLEGFRRGKAGHHWVTFLVVNDSNTSIFLRLWGGKPSNCMFTYCEYSSMQS